MGIQATTSSAQEGTIGLKAEWLGSFEWRSSLRNGWLLS